MSVRRATQDQTGRVRRATRLTFWDQREYNMSNLPPSLSDSTSASGAQGGAGQPAWPHPEHGMRPVVEPREPHELAV